MADAKSTKTANKNNFTKKVECGKRQKQPKMWHPRPKSGQFRDNVAYVCHTPGRVLWFGMVQLVGQLDLVLVFQLLLYFIVTKYVIVIITSMLLGVCGYLTKYQVWLGGFSLALSSRPGEPET